MERMIFVNLPVKDLNRAVTFFSALGFTFNSQFTDENGTAMIIGKESFVMLLVEDFFQTFTKKAICDAAKCTEVITSLSAESREQVDDMIQKAVAAGATMPFEPKDFGSMYQQSFQDLDGHLWEILYMDPNSVKTT